MITARAFAGKRYAVFGLARSGRATIASLQASGAAVAAWDDNEDARDPALPLLDLYAANLAQFDGLVLSPGVPLDRHALALRARESGCPVIGDIELFALARAGLPKAKVIGITGTNGKSTTSALIHHVLRETGVATLLGGNIGAPILGEEPLPEGGVYVLELSSFQLDLTQTLACEIAVHLNLSPDHLDRHHTMKGYAAAKARLFQMQTQGGVAVIGVDDEDSVRMAGHAKGPVIPVSGARPLDRGIAVADGVLTVDGENICRQSEWPSLPGPHNGQNAAAAYAALSALGIAPANIIAGFRTYPGLPHRMERVEEVDGVLYVNDSKATNPTSTAPALAAFNGVHWIVGGLAKGDDLDACLPHLDHVRTAYLIGDSADRFAEVLQSRVGIMRAGTLDRAVEAAHSEAVPGEVVLLSPAAASYDQFKDYADRGDQFRRLVAGLRPGRRG